MKMKAATTNGALKWIIPYGNQAKISNDVMLMVANTLLKLSPYMIVSKAGNTLTEIAGFQDVGIFPARKNNANQVKIGKAWTKNCEVNGIKKHNMNKLKMANLNKKGLGISQTRRI